MSKTVLFVDDDRRLIRVYADAVRELTGAHTQCFYDPDEILAHLEAGGVADVIVWDMMMIPGELLADRVLDGGMTTGVYLYKEMIRLTPRARFVLLTNKDGIKEVSVGGPALKRCYKPHTPPEELAEIVHELLALEVPIEPSRGVP